MMDKPPQNNKEHRDEDNLTQKQRAIWESKKSEYESDSVNQELREAGPQIRELEVLLTEFEIKHDLDALRAISHMTIEEANTPGTPRSLAKQDMIPITALLVILKEETNISPEEYERLRAKQREYSNAVGILNKGILDHNR